ncbi:FAH family protein [Bordetella bronchiseptica CA90 BB1334]|nr:FAH family protein [Bordetella bronchiseptica CA90 BB1334]
MPISMAGRGPPITPTSDCWPSKFIDWWMRVRSLEFGRAKIRIQERKTMKLGRFSYRHRAAAHVNLAAIVRRDGQECALDLAAVRAARPELALPASMEAVIRLGRAGVDRCNEALAWASREGAASWFTPAADLAWHLPLEVGCCVAAGRNFASHVNEGKAFWDGQASAAGLNQDMPAGFIKIASVMTPHDSAVARPCGVLAFDYEVEVAAVLGGPVPLGTPPERALEHVFGYTLFNDLSAREWARAEMKNQMIAMGKNFPGAGPLGPWIVTADEVPDPAQLELSLSVNGEPRQHGSCKEMIFTFAQLIAHWSRIGLGAGDLIASGTPEGVAISRKPDPAPFFLKPGDIVEAHCPQIGTLRTRIV